MVIELVLPADKTETAYFRGYDDGVAGLTYINPYAQASMLGVEYEEGFTDGVEERRYLISLASQGAS